MLTLLTLAALLQADPSAAAPTSAAVDDGPTRHALILCGLPGDDEHRESFTATVDRLVGGLVENVGFEAGRVAVLFGSEAMHADGGPKPAAAAGPCTAETIRQAAEDLRGRLGADDGCWVFLVGHAYFDGRRSQFNVAGPDLAQDEFARLFADWPAREAVFWCTQPASGFYLRPLAGEGRVVITATEADREVNETTFITHLADLLAGPPTMDRLDADGDGRVSLLDVYLETTRRVAEAYAADNALPTEHAQLDDTADGRGRELQSDYLPEELGGTPAPRTAPPPPGADGARAAAILLPIRPAAPPQPVTPDAPAVAEKPA